MIDRLEQAARQVKLGQLGSVLDIPFNLRVLIEAGVVAPMSPRQLVNVGSALRRWGASPAAGVTASAVRRGDEVGLIDDLGELTFNELETRSNSVARALADQGVEAGDSVAIMCRNHRGFADGIFACAKLGATVLLMNTDFSAPQLEGVIEREEPTALIYDSEFADSLAAGSDSIVRMLAWIEDDFEVGETMTIAAAVESTSAEPLDPPEDPSRFVVLTSGTTGTPKGAQRSSPDSLSPLAVLLSKIPLRSEQRTMIGAPLFHSWGFMHFSLGLALGSTYILSRRFKPEVVLEKLDTHRAEALVVVPVMLQRIMELDPEQREKFDTSSLRIVAASGSALPGELAKRWMDAFGDNLYNLYGSTEVAWASIATPADMRDAPGTAGRPPHGTVVRIVDEDGKTVPDGETGRIFVGNEMSFDGYTGGGGKELLDNLLSSGDVGHFDEKGRLFIDGRDDEMIVSGGENVFPREVEDLLSDHGSIDEAAVIGVDDEKFGQRLKAFVVTSGGKEISEDEVRSYVKENLARYKVPRDIEFLDELPRNPTGKVLKKDLS